MSELATNIARIRRRRSLTQEQLAEAAGVSIWTISNLERGRNETRNETLRRIASALGVTVADLYHDQRPSITDGDDSRTNALRGMRSALLEPPRLAGMKISAAADAPTLHAFRSLVLASSEAYHRSDYDNVLADLPGTIAAGRVLVRASAGHERLQASKALGAALRCAGKTVKQIRAHDLSETALAQAVTASDTAGDAAGAAQGVTLLAETLMRQRLNDEAVKLCVAAADALRGRWQAEGLARAFGSLLLTAAAAGVRDAQDVESLLTEAMSVASTMSHTDDWDESELESGSEFSLARVEAITAEVAMVQNRPDDVLEVARRIPRSTPMSPSSWHRHRLDVANAHLYKGNADRAAEILDGIRSEAPAWLGQQRYARDIVERWIDATRRLTPQQTAIADAVGYPV